MADRMDTRFNVEVNTTLIATVDITFVSAVCRS